MDGLQLLLSRESASEPPQTYLISFDHSNNSSSSSDRDSSKEQPAAAAAGALALQPQEKQITNFPHPYPQLKDMQKEVLRYKRSDGVDLTGETGC